MKKETIAKREEKMKEMKKFKVDAPDAGGLDLIDEFNDELDAMRGADSEPEDNGLIGGDGDAGYVGGGNSQIGKVEAGSPFRIGVAQPYNQALEALEDDEALEEEEQDPIKYFDDDLKEQLKRYREQKALREQ